MAVMGWCHHFQSVRSAGRMLLVCRSVEVRDGNVLWKVSVEDFFVWFFYDSEIRLNKNAIKVNSW